MSEVKTLVPKQRFSEFRDAGTWEVKELGDLSTILRGGSPRPIDDYMTLESSGLNWLKIADVDKESKYVTCTKERVKVTALSKTREVNPGDLIMSNSMSFGRPYILKIKSCIHDGWIAVTEIDEKANRDYLYYLILSPESQSYFLNNAAGSGVLNLNADIIKLLPVLIPKPKEQQKIANCLSSLDELITAHSQKHAALKAHKKGLMQQLFPCEGKTTPKLRFPEFRGKGEWVLLPIGDRVDFLSGYTFKGSSMSENPSGIKLLRGINLTEGVIRHNQNIDRYYIGSMDNLEKYRVKENDLVIAMDGSKVGKNVALITPPDEGALLVQRVARLRSDCVTSIQFIFQLINSLRFQAYVEKVNTSSGIPHISAKQINDFQVYFPIPTEQKKIADCLSSIDELITTQSKKIESLKAHKKGLMQQLFPTTDEVEI